MRITIAMGAFFPMPPAPCGAVEYVWHGLAEAFARRGHAVTVLCRAHPSQAPDETVSGVRYIRRMQPTRTGSLRRDLLKDLAYSLRMLPRLPAGDILVTNVVFLPPLVSLLRPGRGLQVVNVQRMPKGQMRLYARAARLAVVSGAVRDAVLRERPGAAARVRVIPNPIATSVFVPPAAERDFSAPERSILYTGRIHPEKGLLLLVEAFRALAAERPGLALRLVGPSRVASGGGGDDYLRQLRSAAGPAPLEIAEPIFDRPALAAALQNAHYFCYPSLADRGETFGVAPLEAMGTGLAPVLSDLTCFRDFAEPGVNGLIFDHRSADPRGALVRALATLIDDPAGARRMGRAAAATARRFGYEAVADAYLADFEELLRAAGRSRAAPAEARA